MEIEQQQYYLLLLCSVTRIIILKDTNLPPATHHYINVNFKDFKDTLQNEVLQV
jgi:hypothetical protein